MTDLTPEEGAKASLNIIFNQGQEVNSKMPKVFVKGYEKGKGTNVYDGTNAPWGARSTNAHKAAAHSFIQCALPSFGPRIVDMNLVAQASIIKHDD